MGEFGESFVLGHWHWMTRCTNNRAECFRSTPELSLRNLRCFFVFRRHRPVRPFLDIEWYNVDNDGHTNGELKQQHVLSFCLCTW